MHHFQFTASRDLLNITLKYAEVIGLKMDMISSKCSVENIFNNDSPRLSIHEFQMIWSYIKNNSGDINFGLHFGEFCGNLLKRHLIFAMMTNCKSLKQAIEKNLQYHNLIIDLISPKLHLKDDYASLSWKINRSETFIDRDLAEAIMTIQSSTLKALLENSINFHEVRFCHPKPSDTKEHERIFKAPLVFSSKQNEIIFDKSYFDAPLFLSNPGILDELERVVQKQVHLAYSFNTYTEKISGLITKRIFSDENTDIESISEELSLVSRTLQMKLTNEGTSFRQIFDEVRKRIALTALGNIDNTISEIALMLKFSDQSAFNNAFKRWTGMTPGKYRKNLIPHRC